MVETITKPPQHQSKPSSPATGQAGGMMPFTQHLAELRRRLMFCLGTVLVISLLTFLNVNTLILTLQTLVPPSTLFVQLSPGEVFLSGFKLSVLAGVGLSLPVILYHVIRFVSPGLQPRERRFVLPIVSLGLLLFVAGVAFGFKVILPMMLAFLLDFGQEVAINQLSIAYFLDFCTGFLFAAGLVFQIPLFMLFLSFTGLVTSAKLVKQWKWAVVCGFLLGAIITPSADPFSQSVMATTLMGLYGFSIGLVKVFGR